MTANKDISNGYFVKPIIFILSISIYLSLMLPWYIDIAVTSLTVFIFVRESNKNLLLILVSLLLSVAMLEVFIRQLMIESYYRPHEKWSIGQRYQANINDKMKMPHGDLVAMMSRSNKNTELISEPRIVEFRTDNYGFRNDTEYGNQKLVLVGDSFLAGNGSNQNDTLPYLLKLEQGLDVYALGHPGEPVHYATRAQKFMDDYPEFKGKFVFLFFEGNDFNNSGRKFKTIMGKIKAILQRDSNQNIYDVIRLKVYSKLGLQYPVKFYGMARKIEAKNKVSVFKVDGIPVGFNNAYISQSTTDNGKPFYFPASQRVIKNTACILYIPTKYRVYAPLIDMVHTPLKRGRSSVDLEAFTHHNGIMFFDMTNTLQKKAKMLLEKKQFLFWRDDTHWNKAGMSITAHLIANKCQ